MPGRLVRTRPALSRLAVTATVLALLATASPVATSAEASAGWVRAAAPGPHFVVGMVCVICKNPPSTIAGQSFKLRVTAKNALNQTLTGYVGGVTIQSTDAKAPLIVSHFFQPAEKGVYEFSYVLKTTVPGGDHKQTVTASAPPGSPVMPGSLGIVVKAAAPSALQFTAQPASGVAGGTLGTTVVEVRDAYDNVTASPAPVTLSLVAPAGIAAALTCSDGTSVAAPDGSAAFSGCSIDHPGTGFRLLASSGALTTTSTPFDISEGPLATAPPSASPSPSGSPAPSPSLIVISPLMLTASSSTVAYPGEVTLSVAFGGSGAGRLISIERRDAGTSSWAAAGTVTTDAAGDGSLEYLPARTAEYRAVWAGDAGLPTQTSPVVAVAVKFQVIVSPAAKTRTTTAGKTLTWIATVRPKTSGVTVRFRLYRLVKGAWVVAGTTPVTTNAQGKAAWSQKFSAKGRWSVVITALNGPANAAGTAPRKYITVK